MSQPSSSSRQMSDKLLNDVFDNKTKKKKYEK